LVILSSVNEDAEKHYKNCETLTINNANNCFYDTIFKYNKAYADDVVEKTLTYFD